MKQKKIEQVETIEHDYWDDTDLPGVIDPELPIIVDAAQEPKQYYHPAKWKGIVDTYQCDFCGHCDQSLDEMKLHVLKHVPESEREELFNKLIKEQK